MTSLLAGCTSLESYPAGRLGPDLPIAVGDEISGESAADGGTIVTYRWDNISSIVHRRPDAGKSLGLAIVVVWLLYETKDFAESFSDLFESHR